MSEATAVAPTSSDNSRYPCPECGANTQFSPGSGTLHCEYCGADTPIAQVPAEVAEQPLAEALSRAHRGDVSALAPGGHEIVCKTCGARSVLTAQSARCAFCDGTMVVEVTTHEPMLTPQAVLPFHIKGDDAKATYSKWMSSRWFAPSDLNKRAERGALDGVYLPYWTFDSETSTNYRGERGDHYYVTVSYKDSDGHTRTRQEQRTRWSNASGRVEVLFDDVLVPATEALPRKLVHKLEPWDLPSAKPFDGAYLSGFIANRYTLELGDAFPLAEERMEPKIESAIRSDIGGDVQRIHAKQIHHSNTTFKHVLMPLWVSSFRYKEKVFRVVVNARSGELAGERPYSAFKIFFFVLFIIGLIVGTVVLVQQLRKRSDESSQAESSSLELRSTPVAVMPGATVTAGVFTVLPQQSELPTAS